MSVTKEEAAAIAAEYAGENRHRQFMRCPACAMQGSRADGELSHEPCCPVGVRLAAECLLASRFPPPERQDTIGLAMKTAHQYALAWCDPWCREARHWRMLAEEVAHQLSHGAS